ncbi:MAG TPA: TlpA disulfide reductase family protein [Acidimicrobiales bacterium]|jgi:peroxiredoxin
MASTEIPAPSGPPEEPPVRKPRKVFLLVGVIVAVALGIGLFTNLGNNPKTDPAPHVGGTLPTFSGTYLNGHGSVDVPGNGVGGGSPAVLLFFGKWCPQCHLELPPLAKAIREQQAAGGALSRVRIVGVDSEDTVANAKSFIKSSGVDFPVAYDPNLGVTEGDFYFEGDPDAVFVKADGKIARIVRGNVLTPAAFTADEREIIPSGT